MRNESPVLPSDSVALTTPELVLQCVTDVVGEALCDRLWVFFLDRSRTPTKVVLQLDGMPVALGAGEIAMMAGQFGDLLRHGGGGSLVLCWERPGDPDATRAEQRRAQAFGRALRANGVAVAGQFLAHDDGVSRLAP